MLTAVTAAKYETQPSAGILGGQQEEGRRLTELRGAAENLSILIIEDNPGDVFIMEEALREHNLECNVTVLSDGDQAASLLDSIDNDRTAACPNIVLLDLNLPKRSGHWVLSRIRASLRCSWVPVVIVSSSEAPADMEKNRQLGATAYFRKPSSLEEFLKLGALVNSLLFDSQD